MTWILESERIRLRKLTMEDVDEMFSMDSDPEVMRYFPETKDIEGVREYLKKSIEAYNWRDGLGRFAGILKSDESFIGIFLLGQMHDREEVEVGYRLKKEFWGRGYATEMTLALLDYGFNTIGLERIAGVTVPENKVSSHILKKAGLKFERITEVYGIEVEYYGMRNPALDTVKE